MIFDNNGKLLLTFRVRAKHTRFGEIYLCYLNGQRVDYFTASMVTILPF
jgi:hypothetical protein